MVTDVDYRLTAPLFKVARNGPGPRPLVRAVLGRFLFAVLALFFLGGTSFGAEPFTVISADDPLLEDLRYLVREGGKSFLSLTPPLSRDEVYAILNELETENLSGPALRRYQRVLDAMVPPLSYVSPNFSAAFHINAALEGRFRSNTGVAWQKQDNRSRSLIGLPLHFFFSDTLELFLEPLLAVDPWYYNHPASNWGSNVPWMAERFDLNMPLRAFAAAGGNWWAFQIGRDRLSFGPGITGNMAVSDNPDYYDFARISFFSGNFKYSALISQMPLNAEHLVADSGDLIPPSPEVSGLIETTNRYLYLHRLDFRLFEKFSVGLSEGVMAGNSPLELRYLNPIMVFHSFFSWRDYPGWGKKSGSMTGSLFSLDLEWAFLSGWALYGQIVMNEFSTPYEASRYPDQPPSGMGYLLGAEYAASFNDWALSFYGELVYADPFLYTLSSPFASMIWMRRLSDLGTKDLRYMFFGHTEGRDMFLAALGAAAQNEKLSVRLDLSFKMQGGHGLEWDWDTEYNNQRSPSGNPETRIRLGLGLGYRLFPGFTIEGNIGETLLLDAAHVRGERKYGFEAGLGVRYYY
ncbi:MAG: capsule assembly Wzi family protein [Spirochaetaceae bacterium]|jgi:hypothetical protein|nr:capsule assembly Wzi family protein [Spirochaetaceae bacterium]